MSFRFLDHCRSQLTGREDILNLRVQSSRFLLYVKAVAYGLWLEWAQERLWKDLSKKSGKPFKNLRLGLRLKWTSSPLPFSLSLVAKGCLESHCYDGMCGPIYTDCDKSRIKLQIASMPNYSRPPIQYSMLH